RVVVALDVHASAALPYGRERQARVTPFDQHDQPPTLLLHDQIHGQVGEIARHQAVERVRRPAAHEVGELLHEGVLARALADLLGDPGAHTPQASVAEGVGLTGLDWPPTQRARALRHGEHGVVAGIPPLVLHEQIREAGGIEGYLRDDRAV